MTRHRTTPRRRALPPHDPPPHHTPPPRASTPCPAATRIHLLPRRRAPPPPVPPPRAQDSTGRRSREPDPASPLSSVFFPASLPRTGRLLLGGPAPLRLAVQPRHPRPFTVAAPPSVRAMGSRARPLPKLARTSLPHLFSLSVHALHGFLLSARHVFAQMSKCTVILVLMCSLFICSYLVLAKCHSLQYLENFSCVICTLGANPRIRVLKEFMYYYHRSSNTTPRKSSPHSTF
ncbi:hypothetical protein VPH35_037335 [Triticum aestivum]|uniref:Uncharacterized protein n=1 Tax=Aegilops tauschii subsp. strangulata TaxID=200361 RepID=A0A453BST2_AEGTS